MAYKWTVGVADPVKIVNGMFKGRVGSHSITCYSNAPLSLSPHIPSHPVSLYRGFLTRNPARWSGEHCTLSNGSCSVTGEVPTAIDFIDFGTLWIYELERTRLETNEIVCKQILAPPRVHAWLRRLNTSHQNTSSEPWFFGYGSTIMVNYGELKSLKCGWTIPKNVLVGRDPRVTGSSGGNISLPILRYIKCV